MENINKIYKELIFKIINYLEQNHLEYLKADKLEMILIEGLNQKMFDYNEYHILRKMLKDKFKSILVNNEGEKI